LCIFLTISIIFSIPLQIVHILKTGNPFPIDWATTFVSIGFSFVEFLFSIFSIYTISERKTALYILRNSQTMSVNPKQRIKSSAEIEEELFEKFPSLRKKNNNNNNNNLPAISKKRN